MKRTYKVLIAQQGTITPYRIPLYNEIERRRPADWTFKVVQDADPDQKHDFYRGMDGKAEYAFQTLPVSSHAIRVGGRTLMWQRFFRKALSFDVLVTDTYVKHLTYLSLFIYRLLGKKLVWWGIPKDVQAVNPSTAKRAAEMFKHRLLHLTNHFLAYTAGSKEFLIQAGYPADKITVLNNTIDIESERRRFERYRGERESTRREMLIAPERKVVLYVGRLTRLKRIPVLLDLIRELKRRDPSYLLLIIGAGEFEAQVRKAATEMPDALRYLGTVDDPEQTAKVHIASDLYYIPGYIGLAPLQALCYDLPVIAMSLDWHSPEVEYLNSRNSELLPDGLTPAELAVRFEQAARRLSATELRQELYSTISHLTIGAMAERYVQGINRVLGLS